MTPTITDEARIIAKLGFHKSIFWRIQNRHIVSIPGGTTYRDIAIDHDEIIRLQKTLYNLESTVQEMINNGYEDTYNLITKIKALITEIEECTRTES